MPAILKPHLFFRGHGPLQPQLKTWPRLLCAAAAITVVHAILWTTVFWYGFDNTRDLVRMFS